MLVDHNDPQQSIAHREKYTITHLIDHHAFGTFSTPSPLYVRVEPVGCTCTVMYHIFKEHNYTPSQETAYMMISAILSDTLHFRSPTTTDADKKACLELQSLANIKDLGSHAMAMFDAKSDL
ncbi:hypothetical protein GW750_03140 [bacterium]|nr:hypothetical protein [bacterium]